MSKRLIRIAAADVAIRLPELSGQDLNVIIRSGNTYFGRLISYSSDLLTLRDTRGHWHTIPVPDIEEVIYDKKSPY